jgi:hypothetical protein
MGQPMTGSSWQVSATSLLNSHFAELHARVQRSITEIVEEITPEDGGAVIVPEGLSRHFCRAEVAIAADLFDETSAMATATQALDAARATGNEEMIDAAYTHYDRELV